MKINKYFFASIILIIVILASVLFSQMQHDAMVQVPYTIGSSVIPATQMPPGMVMKMFTVVAPEPTPTIAFDLTHDSMGGWDVHVMTTNFTFAPEHLNGAPVAGEGHVHLYIDDNLIIMLGPWQHIDSLTPGIHTIKVGLFNNDHSAYMVNGARIETEKQVNGTI